MATEKIQTTVSWAQDGGKQDVLSQIKWVFQKLKNKPKSWSENKEQHRTKAFTLTRKDSTISVIVALAIVVGAVVYWGFVIKNYSEINEGVDKLKDVSTYNVTPNTSVLAPHMEWNDVNKINWMIAINDNIQETVDGRELFKEQQKSYYEVLLQNIYLPSLNIWKDPYTKNFDMTILWQKYLEADKFQDLYLIQYWSDFIKYVGNDADYNTVESIVIWEKTELEWTDYFYTPVSISFKSPNKRSFLLLVNKLSMTSNTNNIALVNEFFFYLLMNIRERKSAEIDSLWRQYFSQFANSSDWVWANSYDELKWDELSKYQDKVIWYNLYHWLNYEWSGKNVTPLIDDALIAETVRENVLCDSSISDAECFYNFRDKYRNLPYLAYTVWMEEQSNRTEWLLNFLKNLPSVIAITNFWFEKFSNSSFLNNEEEQYEWTLTFNAYWRNITITELEETAVALWDLCFWKASNQMMSPDVALSRVEETIASLWWMDENINVSALWELQWLLTTIQEWYEWMTNYDKMIKLFELWRMLNDSNLCNS